MSSYLGWGGKTLTVVTDVNLGKGATRGFPQFGLRRAVWDIAFGYVSGFKGSAILYYVLSRSLNRRLSVWAMKREGVEFRNGLAVGTVRRARVKAGSVGIVCPACEETILVPVECEIENGDNAWLGTATLNCTPDMSDLWAHMWTHEEQA